MKLIATIIGLGAWALLSTCALAAPSGSPREAELEATLEALQIQYANKIAVEDKRLSSEVRKQAQRLEEWERALLAERGAKGAAERDRARLERDLTRLRAKQRAFARMTAATDQGFAAELEAYRAVMRRNLLAASPEKLAAWKRFAAGERTIAFPILMDLSLAENRARLEVSALLADKVAAAVRKANADNLRPLAMSASDMVDDDEMNPREAIELWLGVVELSQARFDRIQLAAAYLDDADDLAAHLQFRTAAAAPAATELAGVTPLEAAIAEELLRSHLNGEAGQPVSLDRYAEIVRSSSLPEAGRLSGLVDLLSCTAAFTDGWNEVCARLDLEVERDLRNKDKPPELRHQDLVSAALLQTLSSQTGICQTRADRCLTGAPSVLVSFNLALELCGDLASSAPEPLKLGCAQVFRAHRIGLEDQRRLDDLRRATALVESASQSQGVQRNAIDLLSGVAAELNLLGQSQEALELTSRAAAMAREVAGRPTSGGEQLIWLMGVLVDQAELSLKANDPAARDGAAALLVEAIETRRLRPGSQAMCDGFRQVIALAGEAAGRSGDDALLVTSQADADACDLLNGKLEIQPTTPLTWRSDWLSAYSTAASAALDAGETDKALTFATASVPLGPTGAPIEQSGALERFQALGRLRTLADARLQAGDDAGALEAYRWLLDSMSTLPITIGDGAPRHECMLFEIFQAGQVRTYPYDMLNFAELELKLGDARVAELAYRNVVEIDGDASWRGAKARIEVATIELRRGAAQEALATMAPVVAALETGPSLRGLLREALLTQAAAQYVLKQGAGAAASLEQAATLAREACEARPGDLAARATLASTLMDLAHVRRELLDDRTGSKAAQREAEELMRGLPRATRVQMRARWRDERRMKPN